MSVVFNPSSRNLASNQYREVRAANFENSSVDSRIKKIADMSVLDLGVGFRRSRVVKVVFSAIVLGISTWFLIANPIGLAMSLLVKSIIIGSIGLSSLSLLGSLFYKNGLGIISYEMGALKRKIKDQNFGEINLKSIQFEHNGKEFDVNMCNNILLGSIPLKNFLSSGGDIDSLQSKYVQSAFGVVENWEREALGLSVSYTDEEWKSAGIDYKVYDCADHGSLKPEELYEGAQEILGALKKGPAFVHCKAGKSRSAILVAAAIYLAMFNKLAYEKIDKKDHTLFFDTAVRTIESGRPESHIRGKKKFLEPFFNYMLEQNGLNPPAS